MAKELPSIEVLRNLMRYEPDTGKLFWLPRTWDMFTPRKRPASHVCANWNSANAGKEAFTAKNRYGYRVGRIFDSQYYSHRICWALFYGKEPLYEIDHINGIRCDNRIENLRDVSRSINMRNSSKRSHNTSGYNGVTWSDQIQRWTARIGSKHIACCKTKEEAIKARIDAERHLGFTARHGK